MSSAVLRILLVDDNDDDILLVREAFLGAKLTHRLEVARDGIEALQCLRRQGKFAGAPDPGIVLLDLNMPRKSGFAVLREMKADPFLRQVPVVILTTSDVEDDVVRSYAEGACSFITKPAEFATFREIVRQFALYWTQVARVPGPIAHE